MSPKEKVVDFGKGIVSYFNNTNLVKWKPDLSTSTSYSLSSESSFAFKLLDNQYAGSVTTGIDLSCTTMTIIGAQVGINYKPEIPGKDLRKKISAVSEKISFSKDKIFGSEYRYTNNGVISSNGGTTLQAPLNKTFSTSSPPTSKQVVRALDQITTAVCTAIGAANSVVAASYTGAQNPNPAGYTTAAIGTSLLPAVGLAVYGIIEQIYRSKNSSENKDANDAAEGMDADILVVATHDAKYESMLGINVSSKNSNITLDESSSGSVTIQADSGITVEVPDSKITIDPNQIEMKNGNSSITINNDCIRIKQDTLKIMLSENNVDITNSSTKASFGQNKIKILNLQYENGKLAIQP